ncbi:MAG: AMIN domain-containing protein [Gammaproteobacteria bacterium]|jgi:N-acetylmuramoyl-L-alanine amidase|nr:AMIN domain-containing protein [Gammaproteobacteria bacterium]
MSRFFALFTLLIPLLAVADPAEISGARLWIAPDQTQLVIDANAPLEHKIFPVTAPDRLIIDIPDARVTGKLPLAEPADLLVKGVRSGVLDKGQLRIVIDLKQAVRAKSFVLEPNERYGHRLVVDMAPKTDKPRAGNAATGSKPDASGRQGPRDLIIAIDPGHGGEDPGAIGAGGTLEKDVTLAIGRKLANLVNREVGMRALLVRDGDYYLSLNKRIELSLQQDADLFVSIHADAFVDQGASGSSVFILASDGATSRQADWLAERENSADRIGGVDLTDKTQALSKTLWEMAQRGTLEHSKLAATAVLNNLRKVGAVHHAQVQKAGFAVLKVPTIPSLLVETAFISNPDEEKHLTSAEYQAKMAGALLSGIKAYFATYPPPDTRWAKKGGGQGPKKGASAADSASAGRQHVISKGDTLERIAQQYAISLSALRSANAVEDSKLRIGEVLIIPEG